MAPSRRPLASGPLSIQEQSRSRFRLAGPKWRLYYAILERGNPYLSLFPSNDTSDPRRCVARINFNDEASARVMDSMDSVGGSFSSGASGRRGSQQSTVIQLLNVAITRDPFTPRPESKPAKVLDLDAHSPEALKVWVTAIKSMLTWLKHGTEPTFDGDSSSFNNHHPDEALTSAAKKDEEVDVHDILGPTTMMTSGPSAGSNGNALSVPGFTRGRSNSSASNASSFLPSPDIYGHDQSPLALAAGDSMSTAASSRRLSVADSTYSSGTRSYRRLSGPMLAPVMSPTFSSSALSGPGLVPTAGPPQHHQHQPYQPQPQQLHQHHQYAQHPHHYPQPHNGFNTGAESRGRDADRPPIRTKPKSLFIGAGPHPTPPSSHTSGRFAIGYNGSGSLDDVLLPSPTASHHSFATNTSSYSRSRSVGPPVHRAMPSRIEDLMAALPTPQAASTANRALPRPTSILSTASRAAPLTPTSLRYTNPNRLSIASTAETSASAPAQLARMHHQQQGVPRRKSHVAMQMDSLLDDLDEVLQSLQDEDAPPVPPLPANFAADQVPTPASMQSQRSSHASHGVPSREPSPHRDRVIRPPQIVRTPRVASPLQ